MTDYTAQRTSLPHDHQPSPLSPPSTRAADPTTYSDDRTCSVKKSTLPSPTTLPRSTPITQTPSTSRWNLSTTQCQGFRRNRQLVYTHIKQGGTCRVSTIILTRMQTFAISTLSGLQMSSRACAVSESGGSAACD